MATRGDMSFTPPKPLGDKAQGGEKVNTKDIACALGQIVGQLP